MGLEEYIGWKRILVYNVWPWFRCGQEVTGGKNIHSDFSRVPAVCDSASRIVDALKPSKIAALGEWSYWRGPSWLQSTLLAGSKYAPSGMGAIGFFYHPSQAWYNRWAKKIAGSWIPAKTAGIKNSDEFIDFIA